MSTNDVVKLSNLMIIAAKLAKSARIDDKFAVRDAFDMLLEKIETYSENVYEERKAVLETVRKGLGSK